MDIRAALGKAEPGKLAVAAAAARLTTATALLDVAFLHRETTAALDKVPRAPATVAAAVVARPLLAAMAQLRSAAPAVLELTSAPLLAVQRFTKARAAGVRELPDRAALAGRVLAALDHPRTQQAGQRLQTPVRAEAGVQLAVMAVAGLFM